MFRQASRLPCQFGEHLLRYVLSAVAIAVQYPQRSRIHEVHMSLDQVPKSRFGAFQRITPKQLTVF
jgi:hypothetical protein